MTTSSENKQNNIGESLYYGLENYKNSIITLDDSITSYLCLTEDDDDKVKYNTVNLYLSSKTKFEYIDNTNNKKGIVYFSNPSVKINNNDIIINKKNENSKATNCLATINITVKKTDGSKINIDNDKDC